MWQTVLSEYAEYYNIQDTWFFQYGSTVYGTATDKSDIDFIAIHPNKAKHKFYNGEEIQHQNLNMHFYWEDEFQKQLDAHKIQFLECFFFKGNKVPDHFKFKLNLSKLRESISEKANHSFVKAKKKLEVEKDYMIGWKSLFHSLRILDFGTQIATTGAIQDFSSANHFWTEILGACRYDWAYFKEKYQPIHNEMSSKFRLAAPK